MIEPYILERIQKAKEQAQKIVNNQLDTEEEFVYALRLYLSKIYRMPIFSEYFMGLTLEQLIFEAELHRAERQTTSEKTNELINENKEELSGIFDDWETQDLNELTDKSFDQEALDFMESSEFKK